MWFYSKSKKSLPDEVVVLHRQLEEFKKMLHIYYVQSVEYPEDSSCLKRIDACKAQIERVKQEIQDYDKI